MNEENIFKIILSTDNHLGYNEKDPIRGNDSFITFEEILSISKQKAPDFMLLGGDLFHENKPSISSLFKCSELIRKYSFNSNPINFKIISDQALNFYHSEHFKHANFNDENLNVGIPIFTIHGNHDDPIDQSNLCALDLFHASGLVNLFGKSNSVESIIIQPILMQKGNTKLALYGLGAIRNERLHRLFEQKKVSFYRPEQHSDDWFSIFVIHQNRVKHSAKNYIPESFIPSFIDLVIWGHEHDCRIDPEYNTSQQFHVSQPGSSVATSLSDGESLSKYIGLLSINGKEFKIDKIPLQTVRPFAIAKIILEDEVESISLTSANVSRQVEKFCHRKMEDLLATVAGQLTGHSQQPILPLIRLAVDYSGGFEMFSSMRFSQEYVRKVANPKDMLMLHRKREQTSREQANRTSGNVILSVSNVRNDSGLDRNRVEDLIREYFMRSDDKLALLSEKRLANGLRLSIDKDDKDCLDGLVDEEIIEMIVHLKRNKIRENFIVEEIKRKVEVIKIDGNDDDQEETGLYQGGRNNAGTDSKPGGKSTQQNKGISEPSIDCDIYVANSDSVDSNFTDISSTSCKRKTKPTIDDDDGKVKKKLKYTRNKK